ncbi:MAG: SDR family oxidoreductase [Mesorhizobium sp.]|uniref:SDR family oxidoreductase n=1 Tax=Mesorhizobium sp. TaxID=1871066 RepID=UPI000FE7E361|nr:SDR family oxidoreductase [Mesorhizobium sp.]RWM12712.1 MAG: SDR family oxidoreductase [Mesorhizobium sp.]TIP72490.1 MAG: SDR family oxidoreductase [Mesorhizobium sp.]TIQ04262.1 MAG: SDR family oxidoreductase [Mesorhizobium sp.]TIR47596.1 MAG: SDR family oxidoreductase [Mesorhizobium sp.]TJV94049.1 MAG: SDR family oxidoreductase [Mesorhizobium sp.]
MEKTWLITSVTSGLGRLLAEKALIRGDRVVGASRSEDALPDLRARYPERLRIVADLKDQSSVRVAVDRAFAASTRIDIVVSNAGYGLLGAAEEAGDVQVRDIIDTNLIGSIALIRAAVPHLRSQGGGRILQVSSEGGQIAYPAFSLYHATKWGIEGFVESVAQEAAPFGIEFTLVEPGPARTGFGGNLARTKPLAAYEGTPAGQIREALRVSWVIKGDPDRMTDAMIRLADQDGPLPKRLVLGAEAYAGIRKALGGRIEELDRQKDIAVAADFTDEELARL